MLREVLKRDPDTGIPAIAVLIVPNRMTMTECAAAGIFTRNTNGIAAHEKRRKGEVFGKPPVHTQCTVLHLTTISDDFLQQRMQFESFRNCCDDVCKTLQFINRHSGTDFFAPKPVKA